MSILLHSSQQIILVVSDDFNSPQAKLECFENGLKVCGTIDVNIGKNGLGWGLGEVILEQQEGEALKYEGDKKAPIGVFRLTDIYGYSHTHNYKLPYLHTSKNLICVDDSNSPFYNQVIESNGDEKSYEDMKRSDHQYELGIMVAHNQNAIEKRGSCIFLHVKKDINAPTAGCTAMSLDEIKKIASWLDREKNPILIQIPKSSKDEILKLYPELKSSQLLK
ncbi:MAG: L,D-transpeptidase family protein [Campylobacterota bacterium]|nr:L,D-transpeptidase family protein [Campylobacterota bacterium]